MPTTPRGVARVPSKPQTLLLVRLSWCPQVHGQALGDARDGVRAGRGVVPARLERGHHRVRHQPRPVPLLAREPLYNTLLPLKAFPDHW